MLLVVFKGDTHALIPLYMIGVFISFTLSQTGMVVHWRRLREPGWRTSALVNGFGAVATAVVLVIVATTKALEGAWIIILLIPMLVLLFQGDARALRHVASQLSLTRLARRGAAAQHRSWCRSAASIARCCRRSRYARSLSDDVRAVFVDTDPAATEQRAGGLGAVGRRHAPRGARQSPYRSLMEPLLDYIDALQREHPDDYVTVILPEFVPARWWQHLLHNQRALLIKGALLFRPRVVVTSVPFHLNR